MAMAGFIKTTDHRPTNHRPTDPPTHRPLTHRLTDRSSSIYVETKDRILNMSCNLQSFKTCYY